jgi:hypothetical protein
MKKFDKIIIFFYIMLAFSYFSYIVVSSDGIESNPFQSVTPKKITDFETNQLIDIKKEILFEEMSNIENFPTIFPQNILDVKIKSHTNNVIIAEEELHESGIHVKLLVKHTIEFPNTHTIEILDSDAKGTIIIQTFEDVNSKTNLNTKVHLNVKGVLSVISYLPESNLIHAINTINSNFVEYSKRDMYENNVNLLYQEILNRSADAEGLSYFSKLLRNNEITENDIRLALLSSDEKISLTLKSVDELNIETKNIINDLYNKILLRDTDIDGLKYFGTLLETGTTSDQIRTILLESDEGRDVSIFHPIRNEIQFLYSETLDRKPDISELNHYHKMIDNRMMTIQDIKIELEQFSEFINLKK